MRRLRKWARELDLEHAVFLVPGPPCATFFRLAKLDDLVEEPRR